MALVSAAKPRTPKRAAKKTAALSADTMLRGLTPADHAAIERAIARRSAALSGAFVSRNTVLLSVLREALAREDAADAAKSSGPSPEAR